MNRDVILTSSADFKLGKLRGTGVFRISYLKLLKFISCLKLLIKLNRTDNLTVITHRIYVVCTIRVIA